MARRDDDYWRERAAVLYRALRDDHGAAGATVADLMPLIGAADTGGVFMTLNWMRAHGVRLVCARALGDPAPSRWALRDALPPEWDTFLPADGREVVVMETTGLSEVVAPTLYDGSQAVEVASSPE